MRYELEVTQEFDALRKAHPWIWANNCWHPHHTPLSQQGIDPILGRCRDAFAAKIQVMRAALSLKGKS